MTTKSKRNLSIDDATPEEWDRAGRQIEAALNTPVGKLYHPSDTTIKEPSCPVERPDHYNTGAIEAIEAIRASMDADQYFGYLKGNVMKYLWRYDYKDKPVEDLRKADWYLNRLIDALIEDNQ